MKHRVGKKFGDTLVEVTIAIGIFSMVAVAVVAVVSGGTSGAQSNLESTVAREEMDAQAEALRFIQNAAISEIGEKSTDSNTDTAIWDAIVKRAVEPSESVLTFDNIGECGKNIYEGNTLKNQKAFIINTRKLRTGNPSEIVVPYSSSLFKTTPTYPRIIYEESKNDNSLIGQDTGDTIKSVEGLYIVAVKNATSGDSATNIVNGTEIKKRSAYYDFYIRSCWYGAGSNAPTTISTVVRLYNPDVATEGIEPHYEVMGYHDDILFRNGCPDGASCTGSQTAMQVETGSEKNLPELSNFKWKGYSFAGTWCTVAVQPDKTCTGVSYAAGSTYTVPGGYIKNNQRNGEKALVLYATWKTNPIVYVNYNANATDANEVMNATSARGGTDYTVVDSNFTRSKYTFNGWCRDKTSCTTKLKVGDKIELPVDENITLYAQWKIKPSDPITFDCGDGTKKDDANLTQTVYQDNSINLRAYNKMCNAPTNHSFVKWKQTTCSTDPKEYSDKASFSYKSGCTSGVTLTAQWKQNLPETLVIAEGGMKKGGNCIDIWTSIKKSDYISGDLAADAQLWCGDGGCPADNVTVNKSFTIKYGNYTKATIETMREFDFAACPTSGWATFGTSSWTDTWSRDYHDGTWKDDDGEHYWCDPYLDETGTKTYSNQTTTTFDLKAHVDREGSGAHFSKACVVVTKITLSGLKK